MAGFLAGRPGGGRGRGARNAPRRWRPSRGAVQPDIETDDAGTYLVTYPSPTMPSAAATVDGAMLRLDHDGFEAVLPLPSLLARCVLTGSDYAAAAGRVILRFVPDPDLWPPNLVPSGFAGRAG